MKTENSIKLGIDAALKDEGFSRKSDSWLSEREEAILLVRLQKSNFGEQYYVAVGVYLKGLVGPEIRASALKENLCHVRVRVDSLGESKADWKPALDLEDPSLSSAERQKRVEALLRRVALPWLKMCSTREGLRVAEREGRLKSALVDKRARDALK